jgi:pilus assembly protein Flp/PilA
MKIIQRFLAEEEGQSMVEYGLLVSLIALAVVTAVTLFGRGVENNWNSSDGRLKDAFNATP